MEGRKTRREGRRERGTHEEGGIAWRWRIMSRLRRFDAFVTWWCVSCAFLLCVVCVQWLGAGYGLCVGM